MLYEVNDVTKIVTIWLTNDDQKDEAVSEKVNEICNKYHDKKYLVGVFKSGKESLYENTRDLLLKNRESMAKKSIGLER